MTKTDGEARAARALDDDARERSLPDDVKDVAALAREYAGAELAFQKSRVAYVASEAKAIAIGAAVALVLAYFALMALVFGLILSLAPLITPWGATAAVCGSLIVIALLLAWRTLAHWRGISRALSESDKA